ncbi:MAG: alpha/beta hydrolase [Bifidobacteriaceae bacterium]|jgi:acetyl esterase/lipase|nr:alpha/beta hydrolase [Bifidobacteriaceae bacterium]
MKQAAREFLSQMRSHKDAAIASALQERRGQMETMARMFPPPPGCVRESEMIAGVACEWTLPKDGDGRQVVIELHGGAYTMGSASASRLVAASLAQACGARVLSVNYRLAPEHPYPAAVDDVLAVYRELLRRGVEGRRVAVHGESAGGGLALAVLAKLRDAGEPLPGAVVLSSPWADLTNSGFSHAPDIEDLDVMLTTADLNAQAASYAAGQPLDSPGISPVNGDFRGLPPLLIYAGTDEVLLCDAIEVARRAAWAGNQVVLRVVPGMPHAFTIMAGLLEPADQAKSEIGQFMRQHTF